MRSSRKLNIFLCISLIIIYGWFWHKPNWNDLGRYDLIMAIVEEHSVCIDTYHENTGDKAVFDGHYYSDKAPGPAFLGIPIYWAVQSFQTAMGWEGEGMDWLHNVFWYLKLFLIRLLVIVVPAAIFGVIYFRFLASFTTVMHSAMILTIGYLLGTIAFPYSTLFYGHQFAAILLFGSFLLIYRERESKPLGWYILSGFLAGYAVLSEYPVILLAGLITGYLIWKEKKWNSLIWFILGASIPMIILLYYNYLSTGSFIRVGYFHVAGENFRREMEHGVAGVTFPKLSALWGITFSLYRGLFIYNPFLLLAIPGFYYFYQRKEYRKEFWLSLSAVLVFFLFNSSYYMWWGGWALGPRHLIPMLPFMVFPMIFLPDKYRFILYPLIGVSILFMYLGTIVNPQIPDNSLNPLFGYAWSNLIQGRVTPNVGILLGAGMVNGVYILGAWIIYSIYYLLRNTSSK